MRVAHSGAKSLTGFRNWLFTQLARLPDLTAMLKYKICTRNMDHSVQVTVYAVLLLSEIFSGLHLLKTLSGALDLCCL